MVRPPRSTYFPPFCVSNIQGRVVIVNPCSRPCHLNFKSAQVLTDLNLKSAHLDFRVINRGVKSGEILAGPFQVGRGGPKGKISELS